MALVIADRVRETTTTTGTGTITLGGAVANFETFSANLSDGDTTYYAIVDGVSNTFEVGLGTFTASGTTLARTTIIASSNSNNAVDLAAGTKDVFITIPANKMIVKDASGNVSIDGDVSIADGSNDFDVASHDGNNGLKLGGALVTASATDINLIDGITNGTVIASKAIITDSNKDISGGRNITISGELDAATLDISGDADIDGTLEADAITVDGTALATVIAGTTVNNATLASTVTVSDSTANTNFPIVFHDESNGLLDDTGALRYNPSTGELLVPKLTVAGTTTTVDTVTMNAQNAIVFEGATADANETTLTITDPTADRTITLPNASGTVALTASPIFTGTVTANGGISVDNITIDGSEIDFSSNGIIDTGGDLLIDIGTPGGSGQKITLGLGGSDKGHIDLTDSDLTIKSLVSDKDIIFKGNDGGSEITALSLDMSDLGTATFSGGVKGNSYFWMTTDNNTALFAGANFEIALQHVHNTGFKLTNGQGPAVELQFVDSNESIGSDGTNLLLKSGGNAITVPNTGADTATLNAATQTLTNKTLTSPVINGFSGTGDGSIIGDLTAKTSDGAILKLQTSDTSVVDGDVVGAIEFSAPDEDGLGQAILTAASIVAEADSTFNATNNDTALVFKTAVSTGGNVERARLTHGGLEVSGGFQPGIRIVNTDTGIIANEHLGHIAWQTPNEGSGGDATGLAASITAKANAEFTSTVNDTRIEFGLGESGTPYNNVKLTLKNDDLQVDTGIISLKNTGTQSEVRLYCESSNAHYAALKAPAHADFSGNITLTLPATTGTLISTANSDAPTTTTSSSDADFVLVDDGGVMKKITPANLGIGGGSGITVQDEGSALSTAGTTLNFVGAGVTASGTGATKTITIAGGSDGVTVQDEGSALSTTGTTLNFVGAGVTASGTGSTKTITISGGGGSGGALTDQTWGASLDSDSANESKLFFKNARLNVIIDTGSSVYEPSPNLDETNTSAVNNVFIGNNAGYNATTCYQNTFIGAGAGYNVTTGYRNTFMGLNAGQDTNTGYQNTFIGYEAGRAVNSDQDGSTAVGYQAGYGCPNSGDERIVAIGYQAGNRTRSGTVAIGGLAATNFGVYGSGVGPYQSVCVGYLAGYNYYIYYSDYNVHVGWSAGRNARQGDHNVMLGINADGLATNTGNAVALGSNAKVGSNSVSIGYQSQNSGNSGSQTMVSIGYQAGYDMDGGDGSVFIGYRAGYGGGTADDNIGIGRETLYDLNSGGNNVAIGYRSLYELGIGASNIAIGYQAGLNVTGADRCIYIGYEAGKSNTGGNASSDHNIGIGYRSLYEITSGLRNTSIGGGSLQNLTDGDNNVAIGYQAGDTITSGSYNVCVGMASDVLSATMERGVAVGYHADITIQGTAVGYLAQSSAHSGTIGSTSIGYNAGNQVRNDYNTYVGYEAGKGSAGDENVGIGKSAIDAMSSSADYNTAVGSNSMNIDGGSVSGSSNSALGYFAGSRLDSGSDNTAVGANAMGGATNLTGSNNTCIGHDAIPSAASVSNEITLGDSNVATLRCQVTSITALSDQRDKTAIEDLDLGLKFVNAMKPRKFTWNRRDGKWVGKKEIGFIAQELHELEMDFSSTERTRLVNYENPSRLEAQPMNTYPILVKAIQELSAKVDSLQAEVTKLKGE